MKNLYRVSAFTYLSKGGNKAGVYLSADDLKDEEMQSIAHDLGYSETAFVMKSKVADFKVRFFTPLNEVDLCGHATIATFHVLKELKIIKPGFYTQETKAGILKLHILDDEIYMQQKLPVYGKYIDINEIETCFDHIAYHEIYQPMVVSTGLCEIFVPVSNQKILNDLIPKFDKIAEISKKYQVIGIHVFSLDDEIDAYGRNFAPMVGINEESATGTSNGALACYLYRFHQQKTSYILRQGYSMNLPSEIKVHLELMDQEIKTIWVGGKASILEDNES